MSRWRLLTRALPSLNLDHYGMVVIVVLCLVALAPLLSATSPCTHDGDLHYFRVTAMAHALKDGIVFSRYMPDLAFGYGYPFFNYREPVSYYISLALYLVGLPLPLALNLVYVFSILASGLAAYLLARDLFGATAGLVGGVAYAYAPYQFLNALMRGNAPESVALPLLPLTLWAFRRLALSGRRRYLLLSVGSLAILYLTHNISSLLFTPLLLAYLAVLWWVYRQRLHWAQAGLAVAFAFALTAFFLAPALLEQDYAQLHMSRVTRNNDFHYNFLSVAEMLAPPTSVDTSLMNPPMQVHLGLALALLGIIGLAVGLLRSRDREQQVTLGFMGLAALLMLWMSTDASLWLWERLPLISFVQFPWRLVGRAALPVAVLAAGAFLQPPQGRARRWTPPQGHPAVQVGQALLLTTLLAILLPALPDTYPPMGYCPAEAHPNINDVFAYEHTTQLVGVDPEGSYFPVWVKQRPTGSPLEAQYANGEPITRFDAAALPEGGRIIEQDYGNNRASLTVEAPQSFRARYLAFYFPGWQVHVDGEPVTVSPSDPDGLITFDVPAGQHTITLRFGETPLRTAANLTSLVALGALAGTLHWMGHRTRPRLPAASRCTPSALAASPTTWHLALLVGVLLLTLKVAVLDRAESPFRQAAWRPGDHPAGVGQPIDRTYADGLRLLGFRQAQGTIPGDDELRIDLYWSADARPSANYQSVIHLVGADGLRWSLPDSFRPRGYTAYPPTPLWSTHQYALDSHLVQPLLGAPPGTYDIVLTVFDRDTLAPLSVLDDSGQPAAPGLHLGQVTLTHPRRQQEPPDEGRIDLPLGSLTLLTAAFDREQAAPGDTVHITALWQANADGAASADCDSSLLLLGEDGATAQSFPLSAPTLQWAQGDLWRSQQRLVLTAALESGAYTWAVVGCGASQTPVGSAEVIAPPHVFDQPPVRIPVGVALGDAAKLVGFGAQTDALSPGATLTVTVVWQAQRTAEVSYHVFVHLLDGEGHIVAQSDGIPAGWSRPTTGWLPGEYIVDQRGLTIPANTPPGSYRLVAGMYLPGGERLSSPSGSDAVELTAARIEGE
ncbi:MAG: hypothetical protein GX601_04010 [Anaerolineales bacterium]|nr:hypothetical protein [Anaerolineales bacterium]